VASLTATLRGISTDAVDLKALGRQQLDWWVKLIDKSLKQRKRLEHKQDRFFDVKMSEIVADPLDVVRRIYAHFGHPLSAEVEGRMAAFMAENTREKHGSHTYTPEDFGIDPSRDRAPFQKYIDYFDLAEAGK
jgi:hypothetical protein